MQTLEEKILFIGSKKMLRVEQWQDGFGSWRAGINWYSADRCEFVTENKTLDECLDKIINYMNENNS